MVRLAKPTLGALQRQLRRDTYHIFHFIGHGGFEPNTQGGMLAMEDDHGRARLVGGEDLGRLLHNHRSLRLAVLNSCEGARGDSSDPFSGTAQSLVQQGIPAVVAMQFEITDDAAITFGHVLYEAIADGYPLDAATTEARIAVYADGNETEWGTPVLYLRAPDGHIFDIQPPSSEEQARQEAAAQARREAAAQAQQEADERARREAAAQAQQEADERARQEAAAQAQQEADERARQEAAAQAQQEADERARQEAAAQAQQEADERARQEAAAQAQQEADERARQEAAAQAQQEADERARQEAAAQAQQVLSPPVAPAGLHGSSAGGRVDLRWDPPVAGSDVVAWEVRRDRSRVGEVTEPRASDQPPGRGSYTYTVTAVGEDRQHSAESNPWVRPGRRPRWLIAALAILATVLATSLVLWAPWQPPPPVAPAGLTGVVSGAKIALRWNGAPTNTAEVAHWQVLRDGKVIEEVTLPQATVPYEGFHSYSVVAVGKDGQDSAESQSWHSLKWQELKPGFQEYSLAGVAAHKKELWVVGGQDENGKRDEVLVFNPQTNKWKAGPKLPQPVSHAPLVSTGVKLYLLGGLTATKDDDGVPSATVYSLDNPGGTWIEENKLPKPRYGGAAAWDGKRLVFAGGAETFESNTPRPAAPDIWELRSGKWESIAVLEPGRDRMAAATDGNGSIWLVGGAEHVPRKMYADVEVLRGNKVTDSPPIPTAVQGAPAVWTPDTGTCVFGGSTVPPPEDPSQTAMPVAKVQCLEGTDPKWPDVPEARYNAGAAVIDNTVYVVGSRPCSPCLAGAGRGPEIVLALQFG